MFEIKGRTVDGKTVVSGVFRFFETEGLPLEVVLQLLRDRGMVPCWMTFHREARTAGMQHERILSKLDAALEDSFGTDFKKHVLQGLRKLHELGRL